MDLQPGPFLQGTQADVAITPGYYDFTDDALGLSSELGALSADWNAFMVDLPVLAAGPLDPTLGIDDTGLMIELANETNLATLPNLDTAMEAFSVADPLLGIAIAFAPAAAWADPTMAFVPPDPTQTLLVPQIPLGDYNPTITGTVGAISTGIIPTITLQNITRVGSLAFVVGDTFLLNVVAAPGQAVSGDGIFNGVDFGTQEFGTADANGLFVLTGVEGPDDVGSWLQNWYLDGQLVQTFSFIVSPGN